MIHTKQPEYSVWLGIKQRCLNPNTPSYYRYGGRGVKICNEWVESFEIFLKDVGPRPSPEYSIDRIDPDGNYEPGNCKWATDLEQANNKSDLPSPQTVNISGTAFDPLEVFVKHSTFTEGSKEERHHYFHGGRITINGRQQPPRRGAWLLLVGPIGEDNFIVQNLNICTDDDCISPFHSKEVPRDVHMKDQSNRGIRTPLYGDRNPGARISEDTVKAIQMDNLILSRKELAAKYQVSQQQISRIVRGKRSESKEERARQASSPKNKFLKP